MDQVRKGKGFQTLLEVWSRRKWMAMLVFAACFMAALAFAAFLPNLYRSSATILVQHPTSDAATRPLSSDEIDKRLQTINQEILSRARLSELINRFALYPDMRARNPIESVIDKMRRDINVEFKGTQTEGVGGGTIALTLGYQSNDPRMAAAVAGALANSYIKENSRISGEQANETATALKAQLEDMKIRQDEQEARIREFKSLHSGELPQQVEANLSTAERLSAQLGVASEGVLRAMERRRSLMKDIAEAERRSAPAASTQSAQLAKMKQQLVELQARYSDKYPDVVRAREEVAALQKRIAENPRDAAAESSAASDADPTMQAARQDLAATDAEIRGLRAEEGRLRMQISSYQSHVDGAPRLEQEYKELTRDYETTKELYSSQLKRYEQARLAPEMGENHETRQFRLLEPALIPAQPVAPDRLRLAAMGLMISLAIAVGAMVLAEQVDSTFHNVDDLRAFTTLRVLGSVPPIRTLADNRKRRTRALIGSVAALLVLALIAGTAYWVADGNEDLARMVSRGGVS